MALDVSRLPATPFHGILAGQGEAMVRLYAYLQPVPASVAEPWRGLTQAVYDRAGRLSDWRFRPPAGVADDDPVVAEQRRRFRRWRGTYVVDRVAGDVASATAFLDWADRYCDVRLLHVMRLDEGHIRTHDVSRAGWQAGRAGAAMRASGEMGVGVFAADERRLVRGFVTGAGPVTLLADDHCALVATADGLALEQRPSASSAGTRVDVRGWRRDGADPEVLTDGGWVPLHDKRVWRMLTTVAPGADHVQTAPVALSRIFAGLVLNVAEVARSAASANTGLVSRIGPAF